jgi:hypothetical protein
MAIIERHALLTYMRHLDSFSLLGYRDALRSERLSAIRPVQHDGEKPLLSLSSLALVPIIDTAREGGQHMTKGSHAMAIDHHIAVNFTLKERGFTDAIDNPEIKIEMALID